MTARVLLTSSPEGAADYLQADLRDTAAVLASAAHTSGHPRPSHSAPGRR